MFFCKKGLHSSVITANSLWLQTKTGTFMQVNAIKPHSVLVTSSFITKHNLCLKVFAADEYDYY